MIKEFIHDGKDWLTFGECRYGNYDNFIIQNGGNADSIDNSVKLLIIGYAKGFIKDFSPQNAEKIIL